VDSAEVTEGPAPPTLSAIFRVFLTIGMTAFGGGASAHIHQAIVHRKGWVDEKRFLEGMTVARIVPGTSVSNLAAFVGALLAGWRGALAAVVAVNVPGIVAVAALAIAYGRFAERGQVIQTTLHGMTAGAVGIMASLVVDAGKPAVQSRAGLFFAAAAFIGVGVFEINMLAVLAVLLPAASFFNRHERGAR
jgi:chromate transporter